MPFSCVSLRRNGKIKGHKKGHCDLLKSHTKIHHGASQAAMAVCLNGSNSAKFPRFYMLLIIRRFHMSYLEGTGVHGRTRSGHLPPAIYYTKVWSFSFEHARAIKLGGRVLLIQIGKGNDAGVVSKDRERLPIVGRQTFFDEIPKPGFADEQPFDRAIE